MLKYGLAENIHKLKLTSQSTTPSLLQIFTPSITKKVHSIEKYKIMKHKIDKNIY